MASPELALLLAAAQAWNWESIPLMDAQWYSCQGPRKGAKMSHPLSMSEELICPQRNSSISSGPEVLGRGARPFCVNQPIRISETDRPSTLRAVGN